MRTRLLYALVAASLVSVAACGTSPADDESDQLDAPLGKADASSVPGGAYTNGSPAMGQLSTMSLNSDHTFTVHRPVECIAAPCNDIVQTGRFLLTHSTNSSKRYVRFYGDDNSDLGRFQWKVKSNGSVQLLSTEDAGARWFTLHKGATCEDVGGSCEALTPGSCEGGTIGDATEYSCGSGLGVECCLAPPVDTSCSAATDCAGLVPQFCRACDDGTQACAHWSCVANSCAIVSCPAS